MTKQRKRNRYLPSRSWTALLLASLFLGVLSLPVLVKAWTEPPNTPGSYTQIQDELRFLNGSANTQQKLGSLVIGLNGNNSKVCLNSNPDYGAADTNNCVSSWDQVKSQGVGGLVTPLPLRSLGTDDDGTLMSTYAQSLGYVRIQNSIADNQRFALIAEANDAIDGASALYATDSAVSTNWAGYFAGRVYIGDGQASSAKELCLTQNNAYDPIYDATSPLHGRGCISSWNNLLVGSVNGSYVALNTTTPNPGKIAVNGTVQLAGISSGNIATGMDMKYTCGDGRCTNTTEPAEDETSCPVDCGYIPPVSQFITGPANGKAIFVTAAPSPVGRYYMLVLRKAGGPPTSVPTDGAFYQAGQTIGDAVVAYATAAPIKFWTGGYGGGMYSNGSFMTKDTGLTNHTTYYYQAYSANMFPRYNRPSEAPVVNVTPTDETHTLTISVIGGSGGTTECASSLVKVEPQASETTSVYCGKNGTNPCQISNVTVGTKFVIMPWQGYVNSYSLNNGTVACTYITDSNGRTKCQFLMPTSNVEATVVSPTTCSGGSGGTGSGKPGGTGGTSTGIGGKGN